MNSAGNTQRQKRHLFWSELRDIVSSLFFFNDTATTEIYTLSLHDALPISLAGARGEADDLAVDPGATSPGALRLLEDEEAAPLAGREPGVTAIVRGNEARAIIGREKQLLELSVGAATEGHIQVAVADEAVRVPDGAGAADGPLGDRAAESLGVGSDSHVARGEGRERSGERRVGKEGRT